MIAIKLNNISKHYKLYDSPLQRVKDAFFGIHSGKVYKALDDINLEIEKGETLGIVGKNGAGKSTLLKIITGVVTPTLGDFSVKGSISSLLELGAGFNPEYNGIENIFLNSRLNGYTDEETKQKLNEIIEFADIGEHIKQPVKTYSSGMFARLAFSLAIMVDPDILIVDEALSVGDIFFQLKCYAKFEEFKKKGKTILFVTHDMSSIIKYCSKAILIENGKLLEYGEPLKIVDSYKQILTGNYKPDPDRISQFDKLDYGNKKAEIFDYKTTRFDGTKSDLFISEENFSIEYKVKFNTQIINPVFAFAIYDRKGTELAGTNSYFEKIETGIFNEGDIITVKFNQKLPLQSGEYLINLGCVGLPSGNIEVFSRIYYGLRIEIVNLKSITGVFSCNSEVKIERE